MAMTKPKPPNPLNGMHTAGIFSDMTVDGPEIGTLVLIVDRAKNLPNRKTIGKQDPYCAARLGKEAKKTLTDIRGGQTPKWDQELRFTVHDSPDYYQLKLSVFNDDKKTDLIGETWIDLHDIIVQGGGQSDQWHNLNCKGKYAGGIRIEITYYDARPKPDRPVVQPKHMSSNPELELNAMQRPVVKRRPLPTDPVTEHTLTHVPGSAGTLPRANPRPSHQPPPQAIEYTTAAQNKHPQPDHYASTHGLGYHHPASPAQHGYQLQRASQSTESFHTPQFEANALYQSGPPPPRAHEFDNRAIHSNMQSFHNSQLPPAQHRRSIEDSRRPPPPPAHKARNSTGHLPDTNPAPHGNLELVRHGVTPPMRHDVLRNEAHRNSVPAPSSASAYPGRPTYRPSDSAPNLQQNPHYDGHDPNASYASRHHSYDSAYDSHRRPMQPTVEDVPESWTPPQARNRRSISHYDTLEFDNAPNSAPSRSVGHERVSYEQRSPNQAQPHSHYDGYANKEPHIPPIDPEILFAMMNGGYRSQTYPTDRYQANETVNQASHATDYAPPTVPSTLIPGANHSPVHDVPEHQDGTKEHQHTHSTQMVVHSRGRHHSEPPSHYAANYASHSQQSSSRAYEEGYEGALVAYSGGANTHSVAAEHPDHRRISPSPGAHHTIKRKSVSPAPPPSSEPRKQSSVPFGPDSYDTFNPSATVTKQDPSSADYINAKGKIVTSDGREVDPSDHLPMDAWAPEPEPKHAPQPETRTRPVLNGAQPMPPSGRRQLRITARPHSTTFPNPTYGRYDPTAPGSMGHARLQRKSDRMSALPAPISSVSGPLGPATAHQRNSTPPRALVRASTYDYENHTPPYEGVARAGYGSNPPIPAKVPMMNGGSRPSVPTGRGGEEMALMEEMSRIDIGTGRARRHRGHY